MPFVAPPPQRAVQGIYLPDGWDAGYKAARVAAPTAPLRALAIGDSITLGTPAGNVLTDSGYDWIADGWFDKVVRGLIDRYDLIDGGAFFSPLSEGQFVTVTPIFQTPLYAGGGANGAEPFLQVSGIGRVGDSNGWWRQAWWTDTTAMTTTGTALMRFNPPAGTLRLDVISANRGAGTYRVNVLGTPGAGDQTITLTASDGSVQANTVYSSASPLAQFVYFGGQSGSGIMRVNGVMAYKHATAGIQYGRMAYGGRTFGEFAQVAGSLVPTDKPKGLFRTDDGYTGFPRNPSLVFLAAGINDNSQGLQAYGPDGYRAGLERTIQWIRRYTPTASICIALPWHSTDGDDQQNQVNNESWGAFCLAARVVAERWNAAFLDFQPLFGLTPVADGYVTTDAHPTRAGYTKIADTILGVL
jgi:hypothetical protein